MGCVAIFYEKCKDFHPAYMEMREAYQEMVEDIEQDCSTLEYKVELGSMDWVDFPIAQIFNLCDLYDEIVEVLNLQIFKIGSHQISEFLELAIDFD